LTIVGLGDQRQSKKQQKIIENLKMKKLMGFRNNEQRPGYLNTIESEGNQHFASRERNNQLSEHSINSLKSEGQAQLSEADIKIIDIDGRESVGRQSFDHPNSRINTMGGGNIALHTGDADLENNTSVVLNQEEPQIFSYEKQHKNLNLSNENVVIKKFELSQDASVKLNFF
jgi:hypothetical protein